MLQPLAEEGPVCLTYHALDFSRGQKLERLHHELLHDELSLIQHCVEPSSLKVILDDAEATLDRVELRRVANVDDACDADLFQPLLQDDGPVRARAIHK